MIIIATIVFVILVAFAWILFGPVQCPQCKHHRIVTRGHALAGEWMVKEAWCDYCGLPLAVDSAAYLVTSFWSGTAVPKDEYDANETQKQLKAEALKALHDELHA